MSNNIELSDYLFHYTNFQAIEEILKENCLRATDFKSMNDTEELKFAESAVYDLIKNNTNISSENIKNIMNAVRHSYYEKVRGIFIACFSIIKNEDILMNGDRELFTHKHQGNSRGYGDFAILFSKKVLEDLREESCNVGIFKEVIYLKEKDLQTIKEKFPNEASNVITLFYQICNAFKFENGDQINHTYIGDLEIIMSSCKSIDWSHEKEFRLVVPMYEKDFLKNQEVMEIIKQKSLVPCEYNIMSYKCKKSSTERPMIELFKNKLSTGIQAIIIAKTENQESNAKKIETLLNNLGEDYKHIEVRLSNTIIT